MRQWRHFSSVQLQNFAKFCPFRLFIMLLNLVHKYKMGKKLLTLSFT